ncbi:MAG: archaellar assembly protein FlaJ [Chloroflexi bacterium]|nr:archaellar assembly protein FlaJ [Chloroflexota bacterium]
MLEAIRARFHRKEVDAAQAGEVRAKLPDDERQLHFDMFMHLSYMASLATARVSRGKLFADAAQLNLTSTQYFKDVQSLADKLAIDYAEACRMVAERTNNPEVSSLLLRIAGSLASGEDEADFLTREAAALADQYAAHYERDVESLKKWTDGYTALVVSVGLVVIVSIISMMIYSIGTGFLVAVSAAGCGVIGIGAWILYTSTPKEVFARRGGLTSPYQRLAATLFKAVFPAGAAVAALLWIVAGIGPAFMALGLSLLPCGLLMTLDGRRMTKRDNDVAPLVRLLGGVTSAIGTTVTEALGKIDRRSMPALADDLRTLEIRLKAGIKSEICWDRFVKDSGSELVERTVTIFTHAIAAGGDPAKIGRNASFYASKIAVLREKRALVSATFGYLLAPLHASIIGLLVFIINVLALFATTLLKQASTPELGVPSGVENTVATSAVTALGAFSSLNIDFLNLLVMVVATALTVANGAVGSIVAGGHRLKMAFSFAVMFLITGGLIAVIPGMANSVFKTIIANPT